MNNLKNRIQTFHYSEINDPSVIVAFDGNIFKHVRTYTLVNYYSKDSHLSHSERVALCIKAIVSLIKHNRSVMLHQSLCISGQVVKWKQFALFHIPVILYSIVEYVSSCVKVFLLSLDVVEVLHKKLFTFYFSFFMSFQ